MGWFSGQDGVDLNLAALRRGALKMTETELNLIAVPPIIGLRIV
jgi:hypothetical protein